MQLHEESGGGWSTLKKRIAQNLSALRELSKTQLLVGVGYYLLIASFSVSILGLVYVVIQWCSSNVQTSINIAQIVGPLVQTVAIFIAWYALTNQVKEMKTHGRAIEAQSQATEDSVSAEYQPILDINASYRPNAIRLSIRNNSRAACRITGVSLYLGGAEPANPTKDAWSSLAEALAEGRPDSRDKLGELIEIDPACESVWLAPSSQIAWAQVPLSLEDDIALLTVCIHAEDVLHNRRELSQVQMAFVLGQLQSNHVAT